MKPTFFDTPGDRRAKPGPADWSKVDTEEARDLLSEFDRVFKKPVSPLNTESLAGDLLCRAKGGCVRTGSQKVQTLAASTSSNRARYRHTIWMSVAAAAAALLCITYVLNNRPREAGYIVLIDQELGGNPAGSPDIDYFEGDKVHLGSCVATHPRCRSVIQLSDQSLVWLHNGTELNLTGDRCVELTRGEAWFDVTPVMKNQCFEVNTPMGAVTVLGTSFGVSLSDRDLKVEVSRGAVMVSAGTRVVTL